MRRTVARRDVVWSKAALDDLDNNIGFIAKRNPSAASRVLAAITQAGDELGKAATGRRGRVSDTYEKSVLRLPYIIAYAFDPSPENSERITIVRVIHTARDWPQDQWPQ